MLQKILKIGTALILISCTTVTFAQRAYKDDSGGYIGGYKDQPSPCPNYQFQAGPYIGLSIGPRLNYASNPVVYKGDEGTFSAGFASMVSPLFYLGIEGFAGNNYELKNYKSATNQSLKTTWSYGLDLRPGLLLTDNFIGYFRAGATRSRFSDLSRYATGWRFGLGGEVNLVQNWDLRGEYVYTIYSNVSSVNKPYAEQYNFGVVYKFL